jgi:hypothetical protein
VAMLAGLAGEPTVTHDGILVHPPSRLVVRTPQPSRMWSKTETISGFVSWARKKGVPFRSAKRALPVAQSNIRRARWGP